MSTTILLCETSMNGNLCPNNLTEESYYGLPTPQGIVNYSFIFLHMSSTTDHNFYCIQIQLTTTECRVKFEKKLEFMDYNMS